MKSQHALLLFLTIVAGPAAPVAAQNLDYEAHVEALKKRLPHEDFTVVVQKPFVVIGDELPDVVRRRARNTVKWAVDLLKKRYFDDDPKAIIDVWLFRDRKSYETHALKLWGEKPDTPFGYYSRRHRAMVMNIATGGGTLCHEIVHPFIEVNFPDCPSWFNEGLASLYEQCGEKRGTIWGYTNWRLRGLKKALKSGTVPPFSKLCATTTSEFYGEDSGRHYAQARYLMLWLQEKGRLPAYWTAFRKNVRKDPTGYETLVEVIGAKDMKKWRAEWERWVMKLEF